jgi:hypothetical protein
MKFCAILLVICLLAPAVCGTGVIKTAISLACNALIPIITLVLDTLINTIAGLLNGVFGAVGGLLGSLPIVGGVVGGALNLNDVLSAVTAVLGVRTALVGAVCGPTGLLAQVESALCEEQPEENCPEGFVRQPGSHNCFKLLSEEHTYAGSKERCAQIHPKAHLAVVQTKETDDFINGQLDAQQAGANPCSWNVFYTSGQRKVLNNNCGTSEFVWRPDASKDIPFTYSNWLYNANEKECAPSSPMDCMVYYSTYHLWDTRNCIWPACLICEVTTNN